MLPANQRLCDNRHFRRVYAHGRSYASDLAVLYVWKRQGAAQHETAGRRIGFVVSKKQGKAVQRNRIKRRLRETLRLLLSELREGEYDLVFVGRKALYDAPWDAVRQSVETLLIRARLLAKENSEAARSALPAPKRTAE